MAHSSTPGWRLEVERVRPAVKGLEVTAAQVVGSTIRVENKTSEPFEVLGDAGVPFLRIGPAGVEANVASADWYQSESPVPNGWVPSTVVAEAAPRFVLIAPTKDWAWFEHRISAPVDGSDNRTIIPARIGGRDLRISLQWVKEQRLGNFQSSLDAVRPQPDGLEVQILQGSPPALFVENATDGVLEVPGRRGEPFLRIGPTGAEQADADGEWSSLSSTPKWAWVDSRTGPSSPEPSAIVQRSTSVVVVRRWSIPATLDGRELAFTGHVEWVPLAAHHQAGSGRTLRIALIAGASAVLFGGALVLGRSRRKGPEVKSGSELRNQS